MLDRRWRLLAGLGLSLLCLWLALRKISLPALAEALSAVRWGWLIPAVLSVGIGTGIKALRWRALFFPQRIPLRKAWAVFVIGQMLNIVLPARAGEVGRIYLIGKAGEVSRARALSTVIVEKAADLTMLALAYGIVAAWSAAVPAGLPDWLREAGVRSVIPAALATGGLLFLAYAGRRAWRLLRLGLRWLPASWLAWADAAADQGLAAFAVLRSGWVSAQVWGWSLVVWLLAAWTNDLLFHAFRLSLPAYAALLLLVVLMSGVSIPPLPGNLGVFPYLCTLVLSLFGVDRETSLAYGLVLQGVAYLPLILLGSLCMLRENGLSFSRPGGEDAAGRPGTGRPQL